MFTIETPPRLAVNVCAPETVPAVYVAVYVPFALSVTEPMDPWPGTANVTTPPDAVRSFPFASFSCTVIVDVAEPSATRLVGDTTTVEFAVDAAPAVPVAVNVNGEPVSPAAVALSVFAPAVVPSVQPVTAAIPSAPVATVAGDAGSIEPPPDATANVTETPETGLPLASVTSTLGGIVTDDPATAD